MRRLRISTLDQLSRIAQLLSSQCAENELVRSCFIGKRIKRVEKIVPALSLVDLLNEAPLNCLNVTVHLPGPATADRLLITLPTPNVAASRAVLQTVDLTAPSALLPALTLDRAETLSEGDRSTVRRVRATDADGVERWLIVKSYYGQDEGWMRESAALASVPGAVRTPELIAVGDDPRLVVMEDLGGTTNVAEALDGEFARAAVDFEGK